MTVAREPYSALTVSSERFGQASTEYAASLPDMAFVRKSERTLLPQMAVAVGTTIADRPRADPHERSLAHAALIRAILHKVTGET